MNTIKDATQKIIKSLKKDQVLAYAILLKFEAMSQKEYSDYYNIPTKNLKNDQKERIALIKERAQDIEWFEEFEKTHGDTNIMDIPELEEFKKIEKKYEMENDKKEN